MELFNNLPDPHDDANKSDKENQAPDADDADEGVKFGDVFKHGQRYQTHENRLMIWAARLMARQTLFGTNDHDGFIAALTVITVLLVWMLAWLMRVLEISHCHPLNSIRIPLQF
jgi:hypothetical protein